MEDDRLLKHLQEHAVHLEDIVKFFRLQKKKLFRVALYGGIVCALLSFLYPVTYKIEALFYDSTSASAISGGGLAQFLTTSSPKSNFIVFAKSREVVKRAVKRSGSQISLQYKSIPARFLKRLRRNLSGSYNKFVAYHQTPIFGDVEYTAKKKATFQLKKTGKDSFFVRYGNIEQKGRCGEKIVFDGLQFTCTHIPKKFGRGWHSFNVMPMHKVLKGLLKKSYLKPAKDDPSSISISFYEGLPLRGKHFMNALMSEYMSYVNEQNEKKIAARVEGLDSYKRKIEGRVRKDVNEFIASMQKNIEKTGALILKEHVEALRTRLAVVQKERHILSRKLRQLKTNSFLSLPAAGHLQATIDAYAKLQKEKVLHQYALHNEKPGDEVAVELPLALRGKNHDKALVYQSLEAIDKQVGTSQFHGLNLQTAQNYYVNLLGEIQQKQQAIQELQHASLELDKGVYDLSSLELISRHIQLPNKQELQHGLATLAKDEFYTEKEKERVALAKKQQSTMLKRLIEDRKSILKRDVSFLQNTMKTLSKTMLALINKELILSEQLIHKGVEEQKLDLALQIDEIQESEDEIKKDLKFAVSKWYEYQELESKQKLNTAIMEGVTRTLTSKSIEKELNIVDSHPIDEAWIHPNPHSANRFLFGFGGGFGAAFLYGLTTFLIGLARGLPLTKSNLKFRGFFVAGALQRKKKTGVDSLSEIEIDTLRALAAKLGRLNVLAHGSAPSFAKPLAELLAKQGRRVLLLTLDSWEIKQKEGSGLVDFLRGEKESVAVLTLDGVDYAHAGKNERYFVELLRSEKARTYFASLDYDHVLIDSSAPHIAEEIKTLASYADVTVLSFYDESWCDLDMAVEESKDVLFVESV